jgi:hypothetical protein
MVTLKEVREQFDKWSGYPDQQDPRVSWAVVNTFKLLIEYLEQREGAFPVTEPRRLGPRPIDETIRDETVSKILEGIKSQDTLIP